MTSLILEYQYNNFVCNNLLVDFKTDVKSIFQK